MRRMVVRAERFGHHGQHSGIVTQHSPAKKKKGQKQYNQIKEMSKAPDVNGGGGETQRTFPLYILGKEKVFKTS